MIPRTDEPAARRSIPLLLTTSALSILCPLALLAMEDGEDVVPEASRGFEAGKVYDSSQVDQIGLFNGNLTVSIPLGDGFQVGPSFGYQFSLRYNSNAWNFDSYNCEPLFGCQIYGYPTPGPTAGIGWDFHLGRLLGPHEGPIDHLEPKWNRSNVWEYISPDGASHAFYRTLHEGETNDNAACDVVGEPIDPNCWVVAYTRDGSYLRMTKNGPNWRRIDFPDGSRQWFRRPDTNPPVWFLDRWEDAHGNGISFRYLDENGQPTNDHHWVTWEMEDDLGRLHTAHFTPTVSELFPRVLTRVELAAFGGETAPYRMDYGFGFDDGVELVEFLRSCPHNYGDGAGNPEFDDTVFLPRLVGVQLPDLSAWTMPSEPGAPAYYGEGVTGPVGCSDSAARLRRLQLPTGGRLEWEYGHYNYPLSCLDLADPGYPDTWNGNAGTSGVTRKIVSDGRGGPPVEYRYEQGIVLEETAIGTDDLSNVVVTRVTDPSGDVTEHYFSVDQNDLGCSDPDDTDPFEGDWSYYDYGLPFRRDFHRPVTMPDGERVDAFLSTRTWSHTRLGEDCDLGDIGRGNGAHCASRETYVRYDRDGATVIGKSILNARVVAEATYWRDPAGEGSDHWTETTRGDFDGLGHHRDERSSGCTEGEPGECVDASDGDAFADVRFRRVEYDRVSGTFDLDENGDLIGSYTPPGKEGPWVLGISSSSEQYRGGERRRVETTYDRDTGFLECSRTLASTNGSRGPHDLLVTHQTGGFGDGFTRIIRTYGGDDQTLPSGSGWSCDPDELARNATAEYRQDRFYDSGSVSWAGWVDDATIGNQLFDPAKGQGLVLQLADRDIDPATGLASAARDSSGLETTYEYDTSGRMTQLAPPGDLEPTTYTYEPWLGDEEGEGSARVAMVRGDGVQREEMHYVYDGQGRLCKAISRRPDGGWSRQVSVYDGEGRLFAQSTLRSGASPDDRLCPGEAGGSDKTVYAYDPFDRATVISHPDGLRQRINRLGVARVSTWTCADTGEGDPEQEGLCEGTALEPVVVEDWKNAAGETRRLVQGRGAESTTAWYRYSVGGELERVTIGQQERTFTYDGRGFVIAESHPEQVASIARIFDSRGNELVSTQGATVIESDYDRAGRLLRRRDGDGNALEEYFYHRTDAAGQARRDRLFQSRFHNVGRLEADGTLHDLVVTRTHSYDDLGRLAEMETRLSNRGANPVAFRQSMSYDTFGRLSSQTYPTCLYAPDGDCTVAAPERTVQYRYRAGSLTAVPGYATMTYHPNGHLDTVTHASGAQDRFQIGADNLARPTRIVTPHWDSGVYSYDGLGNIAAIGQDDYTYDEVNRLVRAELRSFAGDPYRAYTYDHFSNLVALDRDGTITPLPVDGTSNRLDVPGGIGYDERGHLLQFGIADPVYGWDGTGRLLTRTLGADVRAFAYDTAGERLLELEVGQGATWSVRGADGKVLRVFEDDGETWSWTKDYVYRNGLLLATEQPDAERRSFHLDHLGTPRAISRAGGTGSVLVSRHDYFPYGEEATPPGGERMKFTGHERDSYGAAGDDDDMDYMHARYYSPYLARFLSVDPVLGSVENAGSWNRFAYVSNSPINFTDPTGLYLGASNDDIAAAYAAMTPEQREQFYNAQKTTLLATGAVVLAFVPGPEDVVLAAAGAKLFRAAGALDNAGDAARTVSRAADGTADVTKRPSGFRKQTVQDAWDNAAPGSRPDTRACPTCKKDVEVAPGQGHRDWDVDHQPAWSERDLSGMTRKEVLDNYNQGTRLECPSCNRSRGAGDL